MNLEAEQLNKKKDQMVSQVEVKHEEEEHKPDLEYSRNFGFAPNRFTIVNDAENVQLESKMSSDPICSSAGCTQYKHKKKGLGYDIDYFVPHFGSDTEINESKASLVTAETMLGHKLDFPHPKY